MREIDGTKFFIGHGDGLGSGDAGFKLLKSMFTSKTLQWLFARIHPNSAVGFGHRWSNHSRYSKGIEAGNFNPEGSIWLSSLKVNKKNSRTMCMCLVTGMFQFIILLTGHSM
jgi:UDP-2,3-diacylglucosamine pyrophosphatase LpxH